MKLVDKIIPLDQLYRLGLIDLYGDLKEKEFWEYAKEQKIKGFFIKLDENNMIENLGLSILDDFS